MIITPGVLKLIAEYELWRGRAQVRQEEEVISVDEIVARVALFYEKLREIVDWRAEHLLRKTAIERILKRRLAIHKVSEDFAENFLAELVRGGHFPNKKISFAQVDEIQTVIEKYIFIAEHSRNRQKNGGRNSADWILSIAAVEIEEALSVPRRERALIELMTEDLEKNINLVARKRDLERPLAEGEKRLQIYVAVQKTLFKLDNFSIAYHILETLRENVEKIISHPYSERFYQLAEKYDTPYLILHDILSDDTDRFEQFVNDPPSLEGAIRHAYDKRHARLRRRIGRAAFYSILSIFITKILIALAIEVPVDRYLQSELNYVAIGLSVVVPAIVLFGLVATVRTSTQRNFERVMMEVVKIIQVRGSQEPHNIFPPRKRAGLGASTVYVFYLLSFIISFGALIWVLQKLEFSPFSMVIFLMFMSLVLFAGTKISQQARELMVETSKEGFLYNVFDIFSLPMIQVGRWLSGQIGRYNVLVLVLNFLIEAPFQIFVEFLEQWRSFLREKKDEIH